MLAIGGYVLALGSGVLPKLFFECQSDFGFACPGNLSLLRDDPAAVSRIEDLFAIVGTGFGGVVIARLAWRWHTERPVLRRAIGPQFAAVAAALAVAVLDLLEAWDRWGEVAALVHPLVVSLIPIAVLVGVLRSTARAGDIGDLVVSIEEAGPSLCTELQHLLAQALADPSVRLVPPERDATHGVGPDRLWTAITASGQTLAILESDRVVDNEPEVLAAALATAGPALENEQLIEEVTGQLDAAKESRRDWSPPSSTNESGSSATSRRSATAPGHDKAPGRHGTRSRRNRRDHHRQGDRRARCRARRAA